MIFVISAVLFFGAVLLVGYPLINKPNPKEEDIETRQETEAQQVAIRSIIEELELDFEMGNISEGDYRELDAKYRAELN